MSDRREISAALWNDTSIRWKLAEMVWNGKSSKEQRIYRLLLDMRLMQEPLSSLLNIISWELNQQVLSEGIHFVKKVRQFVFQTDFPSEYSAVFITFLQKNSHLLELVED